MTENVSELLKRFIESTEQRYAIVRALCGESLQRGIPFGVTPKITEEIKRLGPRLEKRYRSIAIELGEKPTSVDFVVREDFELLQKILRNELPLSALELETRADARAEYPPVADVAIPNSEPKEVGLDEEGFQRLLLEILAFSVRTYFPEEKGPRIALIRRALGAGATLPSAEAFADRLLALAQKHGVSFTE